MIERPETTERVLTWLVDERGGRWLSASRRFVATMTPDGTRVHVRPLADDDLAPGGQNSATTVVLAEVARGEVSRWVGRITRCERPMTWIVAAVGLTNPERLDLMRVGVRATVEQPEHLPRLASLIRGIMTRRFATGSQRRPFA